MNLYDIKKKTLKGTLTKEDLEDCFEGDLREVLLMISSQVAMHKAIYDFAKE